MRPLIFSAEPILNCSNVLNQWILCDQSSRAGRKVRKGKNSAFIKSIFLLFLLKIKAKWKNY